MTEAGGITRQQTVLAGLMGGVVGAAVAASALLFLERNREKSLAEVEQAHADLVGELNQQIDELRQSQSNYVTNEQWLTTDERLAGLEKEVPKTEALDVLRAEVAQLAQVYRAEITSLRGERAKTAAASLAVREIATAIDTGQPFNRVLNRLIATLDDDPKLKELATRLASHANGIESLERLGAELDTIRIEAIRASGAQAGSWVNRTVENLRALIDVEGLPELNGVDGILRDAKEKVTRNQLPVAIANLESLTLDVPPLATWLEAAKARQTAVDLLAALNRHLDDRVSRQG